MAMLVRTLRALPRVTASANNGVQVFAARWVSTDAPLAAPVATESDEIALPKFSVVNHQVTTDAIKPEDYFAVIKLGGTQYKVTQVRSYSNMIFCLHVMYVGRNLSDAVY